jgi:FkbM family methyltransferase
VTGNRRAEGASRFRRLVWLERLATIGRGCLGPALRARLKPLYHAALRLFTAGRGVSCQLPGGEIVRALPDREALVWNPDEYEAFRRAVEPGTVALDIGANAGAYALLLGCWVGPSGRVYAFEPSPAVFDTLQRHVSLNDLETVVTPVRAAVGDHVGHAKLVVAGTAGESRLAMNDGEARTASLDVEATTVDAFCAREGVVTGFVKIDVEGAELAVLRGAQRTIAAAGQRLALFVEMHPSVWSSVGLSSGDVVRGIQELGLEPDIPWTDVLKVEGLSVRLRVRG